MCYRKDINICNRCFSQNTFFSFLHAYTYIRIYIYIHTYVYIYYIMCYIYMYECLCHVSWNTVNVFDIKHSIFYSFQLNEYLPVALNR